MTTIYCVCRTGGDFAPPHVLRLYEQVRQHAPSGTKMVCLTDRPGELDELEWDQTLPLLRDWPRWWAKLELFRHQGPALYLDLDVTVQGDLRPMLTLAQQHEFIAMRDVLDRPWHPQILGNSPLNSSVMAWRGDMRGLYDAMVAKADRAMRFYATDQHFIYARVREQAVYWQDLLPGAVRDYKYELRKGVDCSDASVIVYHGRPRPWEIE